MGSHSYSVVVEWTGNKGTGTSDYRSYSRDHVVTGAAGTVLPPISGSADPAFLGDPGRWNPEQLLLASLSQRHILWYLHLAADAGVVVQSYVDRPVGTMVEHPDGSGEFTEVVLRPHVVISVPDLVETAAGLHEEVSRVCFIARSVNFPVRHEPTISVE